MTTWLDEGYRDNEGRKFDNELRNHIYPTCVMPVSVHAAVGKALRPLMDANGFSSTELIGYEHNWDDAGKYPVQLMEQAGSVFDGGVPSLKLTPSMLHTPISSSI
ncbi:hypothetical protein HWV62_38302 [Athelia sp. TMB]|nr:hypothetical protein HWV62_12280 [Athelia sp. TMB]KAF7980448.1 hypothetical protein HWV62_38302 [Athelia sp. TMB]